MERSVMLLATGAHLIDRLKATCPAAKGNVFATADLAGVAAAMQTTPALHVVLLSYRPVETAGSSVRWEELWCVTAVVKHAARKDRAGAQQEAGAQLVSEVVRALSNWRYALKPAQWGRLTLVGGVSPGFDELHAYFPITVKTTVTTDGCEG
jgi:hypothetical protein